MQSAIHCSSSGDDSRKLCEVYSNQFTTGNKPCSCCPKKLSCPKFGRAAAPLAPPARTPMSYDFFCTGLVQLVGNTQGKSEQNDAPFWSHTTKRSGNQRQIQISCKPDELLCRTYEMLLLAYAAYGFGLNPTKPNERPIIRFFLEYLPMQSYLEPNNWHIHLSIVLFQFNNENKIRRL